MIKGIIFDVDGTLLNSMQIWNELGTRYLKARGIEAEPDLDKILFSLSLDEGCLYLKNQYSLEESVKEIADDIIKIMENFYLYEAKLKAGVKEFLKRMQKNGIPMIVATSSDKKIVELAFESLKITEYFTEIVTCTELKASKREPKIYLHCAKIIGTTPDETAVFEDVLHGIKSAKKAGFVAVAVEDFSSCVDKKEIMSIADYYIKDFTETKLLKI